MPQTWPAPPPLSPPCSCSAGLAAAARPHLYTAPHSALCFSDAFMQEAISSKLLQGVAAHARVVPQIAQLAACHRHPVGGCVFWIFRSVPVPAFFGQVLRQKSYLRVNCAIRNTVIAARAITGTMVGKSRPELVFGLIGPLGTDLDGVCGMLAESLDRVRYGSERIVLSEGLSEVRGLKTPARGDSEYDRIASGMDRGNELGRRVGAGAAAVSGGDPDTEVTQEHHGIRRDACHGPRVPAKIAQAYR